MTNKIVKLKDVVQFYTGVDHQKAAISWLGGLLLHTPAKNRLNLTDEMSILKLTPDQLDWLQRQISEPTLIRFTTLWRLPKTSDGTDAALFSQRDNSILPYVTCSSSSHAMYVDHQLRRRGKPGLSSDEGYLRRVFSKKYGTYGKNPSVSWDIQTNVCKSYGVNSKYIWNSDLKGLAAEIEKNGSSVVNIYHKGTNRNNRGGGHVVLATEITPEGVTIHDPYGTRPPNYNMKDVGAPMSSAVTQPAGHEEFDLLCRLVLAEARGEGLLGMALVARVVLNRVNLTRARLENFNTRETSLRAIIYAPWQFEPTWSKNNNITDVYSRTTLNTRNLAGDAIELAQKPGQLKSLLEEQNYSHPEILVRSTFFAAKTHPQAISPYIHHTPINVGRQIFGEGKGTVSVAEDILFKQIQLKDNINSQPIDIPRVGIYKMTMDEFTNIRWQGCWRKLLD